MKPIFIFLICLSLSACKSNSKKSSENGSSSEQQPKNLTISINAKSGSNTSGQIEFTEQNGIVSMTAKVSGLDLGQHAIHIHEKSDCSSEDGKSTGGHWNPTAQPHGKWGDPSGYHKGDIGNFIVENKEETIIEFSTDQWCLGCGDSTKDIIGKAIIIHQGVDDFISQPSGAAGSRISCAGIIN